MSLLSNIDPILITNPTNIRYLTGFVGASSEEREAYCLVTDKTTYLFTNALYREQAKKLATTVKLIEISRENPLSQELTFLTEKLNIKQLGFEEVNITVAEFTKLKQELPGVELIPTRDTIENKRMIKRHDEIDHIRHAATMTDQCFSHLLTIIKPGVTETDIAWEIETFFRTHGAGIAFSPIVAFGKNSSQPHYDPMHAQGPALGTSDLVLLDFGARVNGYCADMTRVVFIGKPKQEWVTAYQAVLAANTKAIDVLKKGTRNGATLDTAAQESIKNAGLPVYPHSLGHAVGLDIHEAPRISHKKDTLLKPNMVIAIEPGVYVEGLYGIRIEDLILLKEDGIEILSQSTKEIITL